MITRYREDAMETFILKLAVATLPLLMLVVSVITLTEISRWYAHHHLFLFRIRRTILKTMAATFMAR